MSGKTHNIVHDIVGSESADDKFTVTQLSEVFGIPMQFTGASSWIQTK